MTETVTLLLLLGTLAANPSGPADSLPTVSSFLSAVPAPQLGPGYGAEDEGWGGSGGGGTARALNMRLSVYFTAIVPMNTDWFDPDGAGTSDQWPDDWSVGLGGGLEFSYLVVPGFRIGGGSGYHIFPGKEEDLGGGATVTYDSMQVLPIRLEAALCLPFEIPSTSWFKGNRGFVKGAVPYLAVELCGLYRMETGAELDLGPPFGSSDADIMEAGFTFGVGAKLGFEFRGDNWGLFFDFGFRYYTPPKAASTVSGDIMPLQAFPVRAGLAFYFGGTGGAGY